MAEDVDPQTNLQVRLNTFHTFSKTPVAPKSAMSLAVNSSGHTVMAQEVLGDELPFYSREQFNSLAEAH